MKAINMHKVRCSCGKSNDWDNIEGLSKEHKTTLNDIGYGIIKDMSFEEYLNSLENGYVYGVKQIKYDSGDFTTEYFVASYRLSNTD